MCVFIIHLFACTQLQTAVSPSIIGPQLLCEGECLISYKVVGILATFCRGRERERERELFEGEFCLAAVWKTIRLAFLCISLRLDWMGGFLCVRGILEDAKTHAMHVLCENIQNIQRGVIIITTYEETVLYFSAVPSIHNVMQCKNIQDIQRRVTIIVITVIIIRGKGNSLLKFHFFNLQCNAMQKYRRYPKKSNNYYNIIVYNCM